MTARTRRGWPGFRAATALTGLAVLAGLAALAGCGTPASSGSAAPPAPAGTAPLATSMTTTAGATWAIVAMGGSAAAENRFWELFTRPAGGPSGGQWKLVTPPGVADNGGLVAAGGPASVTVAFRPSQGLTFSPLAVSSDAGKTWATGLLDAPIASVPGALAAGDGTTLALLGDGAVDQGTVNQGAVNQGSVNQGGGAGANWTTLAAPGAIASSAAGRRCQVTGLTAVSYTPAGTPLAAASCARPGTVGIFARSAGTWQAAGLVVAGVLAGRPVTVVRLTSTATGNVALLQAGTGSAASLLAAWTSDGDHWTTSSPIAAGAGQLTASGTGPGGAAWVLLADGRAYAISGPGAAWRRLPAPPPGTATLAAGPADTFEALAVAVATLTVYRLSPAGAWDKLQSLTVPIQYGSSS